MQLGAVLLPTSANPAAGALTERARELEQTGCKPLFISDQARIVRRLLQQHLGAMPMDNVQIRRDAPGVSSCQIAGAAAWRNGLN